MAIANVQHPMSASVSLASMKLLACVKEPPIESIPLEDATARVLASDFESPVSLPPFRRAAMDGYAVQAAALQGASREHPVELRIIDEVRAGHTLLEQPPASALQPNDAVRIFTGAPVPEGYDTVVMQEAAVTLDARNGYRRIRLERPCALGQHIAEKGEDVQEGMKLLYRGTELRAKEVAILASVGQWEINVYKRPNIAVIPIGDELVVPERELSGGQIYDSNSYMVGARMRELGASVIRYPVVPDCLDRIEAAIQDCLAKADIVVTTGGVSVGDYDYVKEAAEHIGAEAIFTKTIMRPGTPTSAFRLPNQLIICLSGNPSACFAGLELLVKPVVLKATGKSDYRSCWLDGRLMDSILKPCPYPRYIRAFVYRSEKEWMVEPITNDKSGNVAAFARANALALIPPGGTGAIIGQEVQWVSLTK
ncbi:molybdopterin molybdotransferase MoeA [Paenibacillus harenae]|uniref:Molybdopterin molybdenumtransferase n=1 Tax=Paenibacillus harenae TaxID=306543 RepID=A0ABT9TWJ1_PAEHA|nr:gephyrin-like molybdotransferase Glp [Paenibacillus harenae]MDQ0111266.1 molybdopterin molybdotransferase [Paenibacillus harenae]